MFIDSHAHLDLVTNKSAFLSSHKNTTSCPELSSIFTQNIKSIIHISLDPKKFEQDYPILKEYKKLFFATGIYPDRVTEKNYDENNYIEHLKKVLTNYPHVALGEIGIDLKYESYGSLAQQESLFRRQLELAEECNLPVIIHSRESFDHCYRILLDYPKVKAVFHCFSYGQREANLIIEKGNFLSFSGILTHKKSTEIQEVAKIVPLDHIFFETDAPYLSPEPYRGKWNVPANVEFVYQYFANLRQLSIEDLCNQIEKNIYRFFRF